MPQIGWFEILIVVILAVVIIGPKDFPIMLKKLGTWFGTFKRYFTDAQKEITDLENSVEDQISFEEETFNKKDNKKNER